MDVKISEIVVTSRLAVHLNILASRNMITPKSLAVHIFNVEDLIIS